MFDHQHETYRSRSWYDHVAQTARDERVAGLSGQKVEIHATDVDAARVEVPDRVEGVPVTVVEAAERHLDDHLDSTCDENTGTYNCVPGGGYLNGGGSCWSSTCLAKDATGTPRLMTSRHPYGGCTADSGTTYHGKYDSKELGSVVAADDAYDAALVAAGTEVSGIDNHIIGESYPVRGHVSSSYCDTLISNYDTVHHTGISTGKTNGFLDAKVQYDLCGETVEYLKLSSNAGSGDSGGPHYWINSDYNYILILGPHRSHSTINGSHRRSFCPAGYAINDDLGWHFGDNSSTC